MMTIDIAAYRKHDKELSLKGKGSSRQHFHALLTEVERLEEEATTYAEAVAIAVNRGADAEQREQALRAALVRYMDITDEGMVQAMDYAGWEQARQALAVAPEEG